MKNTIKSFLMFGISILTLTACDFSSILGSLNEIDDSNAPVFVTKELNDGTYSIAAGKGAKNVVDLVIPSSFEGKTISAIANYGFKGLPKLKTLHIERNKELVTIGQSAFEDCSSLHRVVIPDTIKTVGKNSFIKDSDELIIFCGKEEIPSGYNLPNSYSPAWETPTTMIFTGLDDYVENEDFCYGVKIDQSLAICRYIGEEANVVIPDTYNDTKITEIKPLSFAKHPKLRKLVLNNNITEIGKWAFYDSRKLEYALIPSSVKKIGRAAFLGNSENLLIFTETTEDPEGYFDGDNLIPSYNNGDWNYSAHLTFRGFSSIAETDTYFFAHTVKGYEWVIKYLGEETKVTIPATFNNHKVVGIGSEAFKGHNRITEVNLTSSISSIGNYAFSGCTLLQRVAFNYDNDTVTTAETLKIYDNAFEKTGLTSFWAPRNLIYLGKSVFNGTTFETITYLDSKSKWDNIEKDRYWKSGSAIKTLDIAGSTQSYSI